MIQVFVIALNVVELHVVEGENVICALGAATENGTPFSAEIVEFVKVIVAPVLGIPLAVKLALNQTHSPEPIGVPLKFDMLVDCTEQGGIGGGAQVRLAGEKLIGVVDPASVAVPEKLKLPLKGVKDPVSVPLNVVDFPELKGMDPVMGSPLNDDGNIVKSIV